MENIKKVLKSFLLFIEKYLKIIVANIINLDTPGIINKQQKIKNKIQSLCPNLKIIESQALRSIYTRDVSVIPKIMQKFLFKNMPLLVLQPTCEKEITAIIKFCSDNNIPLCPRGTSSSPFGGVIPTQNCIVVDLSLMNKVIEVNLNAQTITVEPGIKWSQLNSFLKENNLELKCMPSNIFSTVGGWLSGGGVGLYSFAYGTFFDQVIKFKILTPKGSFIKTRDDHDFELFLRSEGTLGIFTQITFQIQKSSITQDYPVLLSFKSLKDAIFIIENLASNFFKPLHVMILNKTKMKEENLFFQIKNAQNTPILPERDSLLIVFNTLRAQQKFINFLEAKNLKTALCSDLAATYIWNERFFPLKAQRFGPNLLACEFVTELSNLLKIIQKINKITSKIGINLSIESTIWSQKNNDKLYATVIAGFCANANKLMQYILKLMIVQVLMLEAIKLGARPYGIGIWNIFWKTTEKNIFYKKLKLKKNLDPNFIINPNKYFYINTPMFNLLGLIFKPFIAKIIFNIISFKLHIFAYIVKLILNEKHHNPQKEFILKPSSLNGLDIKASTQQNLQDLSIFLIRVAERCTYCGACVAVCPAYTITKNELTTGRGKLHLYKEIIEKQYDKKYNFRNDLYQEIFEPFQCIRCRLCEEVCQSHLPLTECYDALEHILSYRYNYWPHELIKTFMEKIDQNRTWLSYMYGLDIAPHSIDSTDPRLVAQKLTKVLYKKEDNNEQ